MSTSRCQGRFVGNSGARFLALLGLTFSLAAASVGRAQTAPANDAFTNRIPLVGSTVSATANNELATLENSEPMHGTQRGSRSLWWTWTATASDLVLVDTKGSTFDTLLAVYTGNAVNSLVSRGKNDDAEPDRTSRVAFQSVAGTTYHFAVDAYGPTRGDVVLNLRAGPLAPVFTNSPSIRFLLPDSNLTLSAPPIGNGPITYQWLRSGTPIDGANATSLALTTLQPEQSGIYELVANNPVGSTTGLVSSVTIAHLAITNQPADTVVVGGYDATLSVRTLSSSEQIFQWNRDGQPIPGATNASLVLTNVQPEAAGLYRVAITNASGHVLSDVVQLTVEPPLTFGTWAGAPGQRGLVDGPIGAARFDQPVGLALDSQGNLFVADYGAHVIRKITRDGVVSTFAGQPWNTGTNNGVGAEARFNSPEGLAIDAADNLYVADNFNHAVRKITPAGLVSTLAGLPGTFGSIDGTNETARFAQPSAVSVDDSGHVFVAEWGNNRIRRISPAGVVVTVAGQTTKSTVSTPTGLAVDDFGNGFFTSQSLGGVYRFTSNGIVTRVSGLSSFAYGGVLDLAGNYLFSHGGALMKATPSGQVLPMAGDVNRNLHLDGTGRSASFRTTRTGLAVAPDGTIYLADSGSSVIRRSTPFTVAPPVADHPVAPGGSAQLAVEAASGGPFSYQWFRDATALVGETQPTLSVTGIDRAKTGWYSVAISNGLGQSVIFKSSVRALYPPILEAPERLENGHFRLRLQDQDGGTPFLLSALELQWRPEVPTEADPAWQTLPNPRWALTNGFVVATDTNAAPQALRIYRAVTR